MTRLAWGDPAKRFFDTGLDRGVLYPKTRVAADVAAINMLSNPSIEIDESGYTGSGATVARDPDWASEGLSSLSVTADGSSNDSYAYVEGGTGAIRLGMEAGKTYTITASVHTPVAQSGSLNTRARKIVVFTKSGASPAIETDSSAGPATGTGRVRVTFTIPVDATEAYIRLYNGSGVNGQVVYWDELILVEGTTAIPYFDGDVVNDGLYTYEWSGELNLSTSIKRLRPDTAVPWDGLTSMDESGSDSAVSYYIDGRPFLFVPKPKEFQATLKAMTYPDAFAEIMGLVEAADGMYLDSQTSDSFDLSYRTLVGNGTQGDAHGYKIHLIYNATVSPQGNSYQTLGGSINPVEFAWDIQAVPVKVPGYRATAHVVIDTRHMDQFKLSQIESIIYGDEVNVARMPDPQVILDLLTYGEAIIINDLGNGEWEAVGSYHNIYLIGDGIFEIDNVNAVDHGDGTYTISSTP